MDPYNFEEVSSLLDTFWPDIQSLSLCLDHELCEHRVEDLLQQISLPAPLLDDIAIFGDTKELLRFGWPNITAATVVILDCTV